MTTTRLGIALMIMSLAAACAKTPSAPAAVPPLTTATPQRATAMATLTETAIASQLAPSAIPSPLLVATSRGPNLEATDPASVTLASGGIQLVEFFRFT